MKKMIRRSFALVLLCMLLATMALSVSATEVTPDIDYMPIELENGPEAGYVTGTRITGLPFTMSASNVTAMLTTKNYGKAFYPKDYAEPDASVLASGSFTHSLCYRIKAGICYYDGSTGSYVPAARAAQIVDQGKQFYLDESFYDLLQTTAYYGYVKNVAGIGAVNGGSMTVMKVFG